VARGVRVGIVGTGWVGASVAISVLHAGLVQELLLNDAREGLAEGEAMDLAHGAAFLPAATVDRCSVDAMLDTDAVVIAAGRGGRANESRLDLLRDNARVARDIATRLRGYRGVVIVVTNPVDVLTSEVADASGLPPERVLGTGTMLDTARLRHVLSRWLGVDARSIHAHVIGEHGDSELVVWSSARVAGVPLARFAEWSPDAERQIASEVRLAAYEIIRRKGATNHAIGLVTAALLRAILRGENRVLTVSRVQTGAAGLTGVALSLPAVVGVGGASQVIVPEMNADESARLAHSASVLREARASLAAAEE
jgi:L-lactate dehydrogenase